MANEVRLPRLGQGMESGTIVRWLKSEGDQVEKGEPLYELDTEKVTQEVEADFAGVLLKVLAQEGQEVDVGTTIAVIGEQGEEVAETSVAEKPAEAPEPEPAEAAEEREPAPVAARADGGRVKASPLARRLAG
ncbi:MAG: biotin/lipoyl-containing protein, partial [Gaiellaceae bacterium]